MKSRNGQTKLCRARRSRTKEDIGYRDDRCITYSAAMSEARRDAEVKAAMMDYIKAKMKGDETSQREAFEKYEAALRRRSATHASMPGPAGSR